MRRAVAEEWSDASQDHLCARFPFRETSGSPDFHLADHRSVEIRRMDDLNKGTD
jgi:hypothetical protein